MTDSLDRRIDRLEAAAAIRELPGRYAAAYGSLDMDALAATYVDDVAVGDDGLRGRDALRDHMDAGNRGPTGVRLAILHVGTHVVDLDPDDPDRATGTVCSHGEVERADGSWFHQAIGYRDRYERRNGRWYFGAQRRHELFYGVEPGRHPQDQAPAHWPERDVGTGTLPHRWPTWQAFSAERP